MSDLIRKDEAARDRIVKDISSNFFVEAGAGSGKTTVLVKRMVAMVESGIDVSRICAITFTKAAAGEFYSRFRQALKERSLAETKQDFVQKSGELGNPDDETRLRCAEALKNIDLCFMGTIDSFCNMILSEHPAEAGIPSNARVLSDDEMKALYRREYSRIQNGLHGPELQAQNRTFRSLHKRADEVFLKGLKVLMEYRNANFRLPMLPDKSIGETFREEQAELKSLAKGLLAHPEAIYLNSNKDRESWEAFREKGQLLLNDWEGRFDEVISLLGKMKNLRICPAFDPDGLGPYGRQYFTEHASRKKISWYKNAEDGRLNEIHKAVKNYQYSHTIHFLTGCVQVIADALKREGALSFFDYMLYLRDMLKKDAAGEGKLIRHIYARHSYFLIDEFQDTDPLQAEIFFYLSAKEPRENWRSCVPHPGSIFIVGDPKQSIYRFRSADVASYLNVKALFRGEVGEVLYLSRNFRSTWQMNAWFNQVFQRLLPEDTADQSRFETIPLPDEAPEDDGTFGGIYTYDCSMVKNAATEETSPYQAALVIRSLVHHPDLLIREKNDQAPREISYGDFMLITPGKGRLQDYTAMFSKYHIPFRVEGKIVFKECPALCSLVSLYRAAALPNEARYLYAALRDPVYHVSEGELLRLKTQGLILNIFAENNKIPETEPIRDILNELKSFYIRAQAMTPAGVFEMLLESFEFFRISGIHNMEYLYYALELLRAAENAGTCVSLEDGAVFLENLLEDESTAERCLSLSRMQDRIHIANLHKVKGLEAPIVILAAQQKSNIRVKSRIEQNSQGTKGWIINIDGTSVLTEEFTDIEDAEKASLQAERDRLLYVAATRARRALIVGTDRTSKGEPSGKNTWKFFAEQSTGDIFDVINADSPYAPARDEKSAEELYRDGKAGLIDLSDTVTRAESYEVLRPSMIRTKALTSSEDEFEDAANADEVRKDQRKHNPALIGTIVHRLMEMLVSSGNMVDLDEAVREIALDYEAEDSYYTDILKKVGDTIRSGGFQQDTSVPQDILQELLGAEEVHCELPFCYREPDTAAVEISSSGFCEDAKTNESGGSDADNTRGEQKAVIWHGIMDVVYKKDGLWHIIDYKTNADPDDLDEKYQAQLTAYKAAFKAMTGEEADARVYHIVI